MSLLKVESSNKKALTVELDRAMCDLIHTRARATGRTQARYVADVVSEAGMVRSIDMKKLRDIIGQVAASGRYQGRGVTPEYAITTIRAIFGMAHAEVE